MEKNMSTRKNSRVLGTAFLAQFITSFFLSGVFLKPLWLVPGDIRATMIKIAENPAVLRANIFVDMLTALGVIFLGAMLFLTLRRQNEKIALVALGFYILEASLLAASRMATFSLIGISQEVAAAGNPEFFQTLAILALGSMNYLGDTLHVLAFCLGAFLYYYLLYAARTVPRGLSLWGLITLIPVFVGTLTAIFGYDLPFILFLPYVPFEFVIGIWILVKGVPQNQS
jgi:hypothetical protein